MISKATKPSLEDEVQSALKWLRSHTICFNLFDRTPHAWAKVTQWSSKRNQFEKRTAFALL